MRFLSLPQQSSPASLLLAVALRGMFALRVAWRHAMATDLDLQKAREAVRKAKRALKEAERRFDAERSPDNASRLINEIRAAEDRVVEARARLRRIDPGSSV